MESMMRLCGTALCAAAMILLIRQTRPESAPAVTAVSSAILLTYIITSFLPLTSYIKSLGDVSSYGEYIGTLVKSLGITLCASSVSDICRDMGEATIGARVEAIGRMEILLLCLPTFSALLQAALTLGGGA